ncbi:MAG: hypothetical protein KF744_09155 [Taibaiella sp.]|nr:hypothetical protein [Taibaiella sp.]
MTTQEREFEGQIDEIGALYEEVKEAIVAGDFKVMGKDQAVRAHDALRRLRDIACMRVKDIHELKEN